MKTTTTLALLSLALCCAAAAHADTFGSGGNQFTIDFVTIGNPGNPADSTGSPNPAGSVPYVYRIGQYEVSRGMVAKANSEGELEIALHPMDFVTGGPRADMPATGVTWNEAARFVNWLNTSNGFSPAYRFSTQPGEAGYNSNENLLLWEPADAGYDAENLFRNSEARFFLPSADEWYKAAYYDPSTGTYFDYPTGSDSVPTSVASGTASETAVYEQPHAQGPADITQAGGLSPYGVMGLGGNVSEFEETELDLVNNDGSSFRGVRGGSWWALVYFPYAWMSASVRGGSDVSEHRDLNGGFRVASIPEPTSLVLSGSGLVMLMLLRFALCRRW